MGYFLCGHGGSGDHGSEDRVRGTCRLLPDAPDVYSANLEEDWRYGLGKLAGLYRQVPGEMERRLAPGDLLLLQRPMAAEGLRRRGGRAVLWGWSTDRPSKKVLRELSRYEAVVVPDRRSFENLRSAGLGKVVRLGPDPAFLVERQIRPLGGAFRRDTLGLCLSPGGCPFEGQEGLLYRSYLRLIEYVLANTRLQIALIPYCVKASCNDCLLIKTLERQFRDSGRIVRRGDGDCRVLRGDLSLCRFCVGASGAMAAWSCGVPALCLGASARSMGLAQELFGTWQDVVVPIGSLKEDGDLTDCFRRFLRQEDRHRSRLEKGVPLRRQRSTVWDWTSLSFTA